MLPIIGVYFYNIFFSSTNWEEIIYRNSYINFTGNVHFCKKWKGPVKFILEFLNNLARTRRLKKYIIPHCRLTNLLLIYYFFKYNSLSLQSIFIVVFGNISCSSIFFAINVSSFFCTNLFKGLAPYVSSYPLSIK